MSINSCFLGHTFGWQKLGGAVVGKVGQNVGSNTRERDWKEKRQSDRNLGKECI